MTRITLEGWLRTAALATALAAGTALVAEDAHAQDAAKPKKGKKKKAGDNDGVGPFKKKDYPLSERLRPLVLPDGMGEVGLDAPIFAYRDLTTGDSKVGFAIAPSFNYGLGDMVELGVSTGFALAPDAAWNKTLVPRVAFLAYDTKSFDFAPGLSIPLLFDADVGLGVTVDLLCRYVLSDGWFVYFGQGAIPIFVNPDFGFAINANGGVGWQVDKATLLFGELNPLTIVVVPPGGGDLSATGLWDYLALTLGGQYSPTRDWDVGARLGLSNYWDIDKSFSWSLTPYARFRF